MGHSASAELLAELSAKHRRWRMAPVVGLASFGFIFWAFVCGVDPVLLSITFVYALVCFGAAVWWDRIRKSTSLLYEFEPDGERAYERLFLGATRMASCSKVWHIASSAVVHERKYEAGASSLVTRNATVVRIASPPFVFSNVKTVSVLVGRQTLFFFPDRLLVFDRGRVGAVGYGELQVKRSSTRFIESPPTPRDAQVVDTAWQYQNKDGSRDLRFSGNTQLPVCLYDEIRLASASGLNEVVQFSQSDVCSDFIAALAELRQVTVSIPIERQSEPFRSKVDWSARFCAIAGSAAVVFLGATLYHVISNVTSAERQTAAITKVYALFNAWESVSAGGPPAVPLEAASASFSKRVDSSQREAIRLFPALGVAGTKENTLYLSRYNAYRARKPNFFNSPDWPLQLAREVCVGLPEVR